MTANIAPRDWALYTDLYQLTMAQAYIAAGKGHMHSAFTMHFRDYPFQGGYAVACGMAQLAQIMDEYHFSDSDISYLASLDAPSGGKLFTKDFLEYLADLELSININAVPEGTIVFPNEPLVVVTGPIVQCQMIETALLNAINFQTLVATKASRVCHAAQGAPVTEFGLRRAQGEGGIWASRAAYIGGCVGTSNVLAGKLFDIPVSGTHSHSWVMSFPTEIEAFREYARISPNNCSLLVDTYNVKEGIKAAIEVAHEMEERGDHLSAIRIDSGDLSWLAKMAREMLDEAGLEDVKIMLTNDLDERTIGSILDEGAPVDLWGVGTKLATAYDQPALGGIYKLSAISEDEGATWTGKLKISESVAKMTIPGILNVRRYTGRDGKLAGDMVFDMDAPGNDDLIIDPVDPLRQKRLAGLEHEDLLTPLIEDGKIVPDAVTSATESRERALKGLQQLDETQLRLLNPHTYPVGFERGLHERRDALVSKMRELN